MIIAPWTATGEREKRRGRNQFIGKHSSLTVTCHGVCVPELTRWLCQFTKMGQDVNKAVSGCVQFNWFIWLIFKGVVVDDLAGLDEPTNLRGDLDLLRQC